MAPRTGPVTIRGERVKQAREHRGWSQTQLGVRSRVDQSSISKIEKGETKDPSDDKRERLAEALGVDEAWLRGRSDEPSYLPAAELKVSEDEGIEPRPLDDDETDLERAIVHRWSEATSRERDAYTKAMREDAIAASRGIGRFVQAGVDLPASAKYYLDGARAAHRDGMTPRDPTTIQKISELVTMRLLPTRPDVTARMIVDADAAAAAEAEEFEKTKHPTTAPIVEPPAAKSTKAKTRRS